jgi:hypothetical protein
LSRSSIRAKTKTPRSSSAGDDFSNQFRPKSFRTFFLKKNRIKNKTKRLRANFFFNSRIKKTKFHQKLQTKKYLQKIWAAWIQ